jgi:tetratricopeptide (TPR) repeat protein
MSVRTGYQAELQRIEQDLAAIGNAGIFLPPIDSQLVTQYVYRLYQRASISGGMAALGTAEKAIERALPLLAHKSDLYLLKANIAFKLHRLADVEAALAAAPTVRDSNEGMLLLADLDFQHGRYQEAERGYCQLLKTERSWGALARLAHFRGKMGDVHNADRLYCEAGDELTAKEMRAYSWLEVQRGFLAFAHGNYDEARARYERADAAYPGYWLVREYLAELLGAEDRYREAIDILEGISPDGGRPDLHQAIGELYERSGQPDRAGYWYEKALAEYLQSARSGEVHFYHHLADYYADVAKDGAAAVTWARADLRLRENFSTQAVLAWALYRNGWFHEARNWIDRALASGAVEAHLFVRAAAIYSAVGNSVPGRRHMESAKRLNPWIENFHIHH